MLFRCTAVFQLLIACARIQSYTHVDNDCVLPTLEQTMFQHGILHIPGGLN